MFSKVYSAVIYGIESRIISVEADVSDGLPQFSMVGDLSSEVREAEDRVRTALRNSGYPLSPKKITVNLAPADIHKSGSGIDLAVAAAVMAAYSYLPAKDLEGVFLAGELSLDGSIHGIHGVLGMVLQARKQGCRMCIIPRENAAEGAVIQGIDVYGAGSLREVAEHLSGCPVLEKTVSNIEDILLDERKRSCPDFSEIRGQRIAKRAAEVAAAGMHNLLISGPPGSGKSMIARCIPGILPPMEPDEALEVSQIHSIAGVLPGEGILTDRPFRMPHHTISPVALAGGGSCPRPGEISLAHRGVLYLDELPEFRNETLEILRQPLEDGKIHISRNMGQFVFPADFMLVASRNPCKCGYYPDRSRCCCSERQVMNYLHRISRPLLDRIDVYVEAQQMKFDELTDSGQEETTAQIRSRVLSAHRIQQERYQGTEYHFNADLTAPALRRYCALSSETERYMKRVYEEKHFTARAYHRLIKVARTVADLEGSEKIELQHVSEAVLFRPEEALM